MHYGPLYNSNRSSIKVARVHLFSIPDINDKYQGRRKQFLVGGGGGGGGARD